MVQTVRSLVLAVTVGPLVDGGNGPELLAMDWTVVSAHWNGTVLTATLLTAVTVTLSRWPLHIDTGSDNGADWWGQWTTRESAAM